MNLGVPIVPCYDRTTEVISARFIERPNRFIAICELKGLLVRAHIPDPGRLRELLVPGATVYLTQPDNKGKRTTDYGLVAVDHQGVLVSLDTNAANRVVRSGLDHGFFSHLAGYTEVIQEPRVGAGRLDFLLKGEGLKDCLVEVKSVTLVQSGVALFPDAPTRRGARHMAEMAHRVCEKVRAEVIFAVQRLDAHIFSPNEAMDPSFARALRHAHSAGVGVHAFVCQVMPSRICLDHEIPVELFGLPQHPQQSPEYHGQG